MYRGQFSFSVLAANTTWVQSLYWRNPKNGEDAAIASVQVTWTSNAGSQFQRVSKKLFELLAALLFSFFLKAYFYPKLIAKMVMKLPFFEMKLRKNAPVE